MPANKPTVLHVHVLPIISGSGITTYSIMRGLKEEYHMELACAPGEGLEQWVNDAGMVFNPIKHFVSEARPHKDLHALIQVYRLLKKRKYDLVHTHNSKGGFIGRLAARMAGGPPVIHMVHGYAFHPNETPLRRFAFYHLERMARAWSAKCLCVSQPLVEIWLENGLAKPENIHKVYSGIDVENFHCPQAREAKREELGLLPDELAIGQVAKLWRGKGHAEIIEACKQVLAEIPKCKVFFVGGGYLEKELTAHIKAKGLESHIVLLGQRDDIPQITAALDIALLASHFEGMGRVILEAMAAAKPVIATRVGGIVDLVVEEKTGLLVDPRSPTQLADAIIRLAKDQALRHRMGEAGKTRVDERFTTKTMLEKVNTVYQEALGRTSRV